MDDIAFENTFVVMGVDPNCIERKHIQRISTRYAGREMRWIISYDLQSEEVGTLHQALLLDYRDGDSHDSAEKAHRHPAQSQYT